jgi:DNA-directed RNA polymerase subunit M
MKVEKGYLTCGKCGFKKKTEGNRKKLYQKLGRSDTGIVILSEKYKTSKYKVKHKCPFCGHEEAYLRSIPPRWGDEDGLTIYTCTKCGKSIREGFSY